MPSRTRLQISSLALVNDMRGQVPSEGLGCPEWSMQCQPGAPPNSDLLIAGRVPTSKKKRSPPAVDTVSKKKKRRSAVAAAASEGEHLEVLGPRRARDADHDPGGPRHRARRGRERASGHTRCGRRRAGRRRGPGLDCVWGARPPPLREIGGREGRGLGSMRGVILPAEVSEDE